MDNVRPIRAYIVINSITLERVSQEFPTAKEAEEFIQQISYAEGDGYEVVPIA